MGARRRNSSAKLREYLYRNPYWTRRDDAGALTEREWDWPHRNLKLPEVWKKSRGSGVKVAVLDTGCDSKHPDLAGQIIKAKDFTGSRFGAEDSHAHGTHCCGVIGAIEDDRGIMGVAPDLAKGGGGLIVGKVLGDDGSGQSSWIARGIEWAVQNEAAVISMSLGSPFRDARIIGAVEAALAAGAVVVCAAGNDGQGGVNWPGAHPGVITVGAYDKAFKVAPFSSRGPEVDVSAPGVDILSTVPGGKHSRMSGTSMATPHCAGIVALFLAANRKKKWDCASVKAALVKVAQDAGKPGQDVDYGYGLVRPDLLSYDDTSEPPPAEGGPGLVLGPLYIEAPVMRSGREGVFIAPAK